MSDNPMRDVTITDIKQYMENNGHSFSNSDFAFAIDNDAFKYIGYGDRTHRFLIAFADDETEGNYYVSVVHVTLGWNGKLCADFGGNPIFESTDEEDVLKFIEQKCN